MGQKLYEMYAEAMADESVGIDPWDDLTNQDRAAWEQLAANLEAEGWGR
jgi:hypothetical protein